MFAINKQVYSIELNSAAFDDFPRTAPTKITQIRGKIKIFTINYMVKVNSTDLCTSQFAWVCFFFIKSSVIQDSYQTLSSHGNSNAVMVMCTRHLRQARQELFLEELDVEKLEAVAMVSVMNPLNPATLPYGGFTSPVKVYMKTEYCGVCRFIGNCTWDKYETINCTFVPEMVAAYGHT